MASLLWSVKVGRQRYKILLWLTALVIVPFLYINLTFPVRYIFKHSNVSSSCVIPHLDPFHPSILKFVWDPKPLICDTSPVVVYVDYHGNLLYNQSALSDLKLTEKDIHCNARALQREEDDVTIKFSPEIALTPPFHFESDFYHVTCKASENVIFDRLLTGVSDKSIQKKPSIQAETPDRLNVLMFGLDSVSRSAAIRKMPKTFRYLTEDLGSYDYKGYMKVGENTLPNLVALLTGLRVWTDEMPIKYYTKEPFDPLQLIWKNFSDNGYISMFAEDMVEFGTFNYLTRGFRNQPADHYLRPFLLGISHLDQFKSKLSPVFLYLENKKVSVQKSSTLCYRDRPKHLIQMEYLKQFLTTYKSKAKFMFSFLSELCHEYPNFLSYGDEDFLQFLKWLKNEGHLENSVLVFFSDHGARIDEIRNTFIGRIEVRMPLMQIVLPEKLKSKYPKLSSSLSKNTERLTVPYDVHQMLADILHRNYESPTQFNIDGRVRGISLFQPVPVDRSCDDAWIPENYCACYTSTPVNISSSAIAQRMAHQLIRDINAALSAEPKCAQLSLLKIQDLHIVSHGLQHSYTENTGISFFQFLKPEKPEGHRYDISIVASPGNGVFEATYSVTGRSEMQLVGNIIRANKYGNQPCISDKQLRTMCYCYK